MTETEKMRAILDELGIEYRAVSNMVTDVEHDGIKTRVYDYDCGPDYQLHVEQKWLTAEEAVRVALGSKPQEVLERRIDELCAEVEAEKQRNAKLREMARNLHMAYVETLNECESMDEELIWECSGNIDADVAKSRAKFEVLRHRFDDALRELGIGEDR